jgi:hypothetical protein
VGRLRLIDRQGRDPQDDRRYTGAPLSLMAINVGITLDKVGGTGHLAIWRAACDN